MVKLLLITRRLQLIMTTNDDQRTKSISYGDFVAHFLLWQKAFILVPLWAIPIIPIVGFICRTLGQTAAQLGFAITLCLCFVYFLLGLLKRKIRLDEEHIFFGFHSLPLRKIANLSVYYKNHKLLPGFLVLTTSSGARLKFCLNGFTAENVQVLLKHLHKHNANLETAPVLSTLVKCHQYKQKPTLATEELLELPYNSRRIIDESIDTFRSTAAEWIRLGPLLICIFTAPMWMSLLKQLYTCLRPHSLSPVDSLNLQEFLADSFIGLQKALLTLFNNSYQSAGRFAAKPIVAVFTAVFIFIALSYLQRLFWKPNLILTTKDGLKLVLRIFDLSITVANIPWSRVAKVTLVRTGAVRRTSTPTVSLVQTNGKRVNIELRALAPEHRGLLLKRLEKCLPNCTIDHELSQTMLPKTQRSYTELWLQSLTEAPERKILDPLQPGQTVADNRFEVLRRLGIGGQGTAYLCRDHDGKSVVLKETILPVFVDDALRRKAIDSFEREATMLKSLENNNIVGLLDYFIEDHRAYLVLEHINGVNLREFVQQNGPLDTLQVHALALQMMSTLKFLHSRAIVHRDFTPDNLILDSTGKLKLIDFNVAQDLITGTTGTIVGKHAYLPPEQFRGKASAQSDLYAFGATLFFLLTGQDPEPISQSSLPEHEFDSIVRKATALAADQRYNTANEIESDLLRLALERTEPSDHVISTKVPHAMEASCNG